MSRMHVEVRSDLHVPFMVEWEWQNMEDVVILGPGERPPRLVITITDLTGGGPAGDAA